MSRALTEYFTYHPPTTEERKIKHQSLNDAALEFAQVIDETVSDPVFKQNCIQMIQMTRMMGNQAITFEELDKDKHDDVHTTLI